MGLGGFGGGSPEGPPNVTEGVGQAPPPTGCPHPYSFRRLAMQHMGAATSNGAGRMQGIASYKRRVPPPPS